jgi:multidrug efflux pump subunit AcrB
MLENFRLIVLDTIKSKNKRRLILLATFLGFILSVMMIAPTKLVLAKMLPGKNNDTFTIYTSLAEGSSIEQTKRVTDCIVGQIQKEKEVKDIEVFLGMGAPLDFAGLIKGSNFKNSENVAEIVLNLSKAHHRDEPSYFMVQRMRPIILKNCGNIFPKINISFVEPPAGPPVLAALVAEVYGDNAEGIRKLSNRIANVFKNTKGLVDVEIMQDEIYDTFEIQVNSTKIALSGVDIKQLNNILYLAFEGMVIAVKNSKMASDKIQIY